MGAPGRIRTSARQIRRLLLYPLSYGGRWVDCRASRAWSASGRRPGAGGTRCTVAEVTDDRLTPAQWRRLAVSAYLPTAVSMVGYGAILPLLPLTARDLGASVAEAALVVAVLGVGSLVGALPGGALADRFGEKPVIVGACVLDAACLLTAHFAPNVGVLMLAAFGAGNASAVFGLARQGYLTVAVPTQYLARALSTLGGVYRIGSFIGPLIGAAVVAGWGLRAAYLLATATSLAAALITLGLPDLPADKAVPRGESAGVSTWSVLRAHARTYHTVELGAAALMLVRASRNGILPLWSDAAGLHPSETSLIYGVSSGVDMLLFYFGGSLMDRFGRRWVTLPSMLIMGSCYALLPLTHTFGTILLVAVGLGIGNGISSGVVMTLGSDNAPRVGMSRFLAGWRLTAGLGQAAGPLMITAIAAVAPLAAACFAVAAAGWTGGFWLWHWARPAPTRSPVADG